MDIIRTTYLSLGTNQGDRLKNIQNAVNLISERIGIIHKIASIYSTPALGFDGADFLNTGIKVTTRLNPDDFMTCLLEIEKELGRVRIGKGYSDRPIDIDILIIEDFKSNTNHLTVPHPRMLDRKFVLAPLAEISENLVDSITQKTISDCLNICKDTSVITKTDYTISSLNNLANKFNYIAIEGNIGAGKTSLSKMISDDINAKVVLERFADNPFLPKFYEDKERYAFTLEMSFLTDRYQQLSDDLAQFDLFKNCIVSDYYIFKSLIFAQVTLPEDEYKLYRKMFDIMYNEITKPDLYVYLYQNTTRLLENIKKRGRDYEQNMEASYLEKIHNGYINFIKTQQNLNILIVDVSDLDFVNNPSDYYKVIHQINEYSPQKK